MSISIVAPVRMQATVCGPFMIFLRCVQEARPTVLGVFLLRYAASASIGMTATGHADPLRACAGALSWGAAILFTYLFNGVMDVREDRINESRRPIAAGTLCRRAAARVAGAAAVLAVAVGGFLGIPVTVAVLMVLVIGWQYSAAPLYLKRHTSGTAVAGGALGFLTYGAGYAGQAGWAHAGPTLLVFALTMSAWMGLVGAPAKDLSDIPGDAAAGRRTLAVVHGAAASRRAVVTGALVIAVAFLAVALRALPVLRPPAVAVACGAVAVVVVSLSGLSRGDRARRRRPYRAFMATQYTANLVLLTALLG
jgi:4-hydroxybenzoate polyprenyltransferase